MEAVKRKVKHGMQYDHLFPRAKGRTTTVKRDANVSNTVSFIPKVVKSTLSQTAQITEVLKGASHYETCRNIWRFVYGHITYEKDAHGMEQVRSPARTWADRQEGVDCDCYTTFISSILSNLRIPHKLRIAKYKEDRFQHIYPIVPTGNGKYITIDCVVHEFDYEEPYTEIKDTTMDLQYLDGIGDDDQFLQVQGTEEDPLDMGELGKLKILQKIGAAVKKVAEPLKKVANIVNKVNPATVLLRNGLLASMKLNLMKVAGKLRWAYLTDEQAKQKGVIADRHQKLKEVMKKLEGIFFTAGGKPENLRKAILTGKGNQDKQVLAGFGVGDLGYIDSSTPLPDLLGVDVYQSEMEGVDGLGEPVTAASITAASAALATIAALIKNIGDVFPKGNKLNESGIQEGDPNTEKVEVDVDTSLPTLSPTANMPSVTSDNSVITTDNIKTSDPNSGGGSGDEKKTFWEKNKTWLKPTLWGAGGLTVLGLGYKLLSKKKEQPVSGLEGAKKKKKIKSSGKDKDEKTPIALM